MKMASVLRAVTIALVGVLLLGAYETAPRPQVAVNMPDGRSWPRSIAIDPGSDTLYVDAVSGLYPPAGFSFDEINGSSGQIIRGVPFPGIPGEMAMDQAHDLVYALGSNSSSNSIFVYNGSLGDFDRSIAVASPAYDIAYDAPLGRLFVSTQSGLTAIDASSGSTLSSVRLGEFSEGMAIDQGSQVVYVANYLSASVSVVSATNLTVTKTIRMPNSSYPSDLALDPATGVLYSTTDQNYIVAINTHTDEVQSTIRVARVASNETFSMAFDPKNNVLYVATDPGTLITELDASSGAVVSTLRLGYGAYEMSVDPANGDLYVTNYHQVTSITPGGGDALESYGLLGAAAAVITVTVAWAAISARRAPG